MGWTGTYARSIRNGEYVVMGTHLSVLGPYEGRIEPVSLIISH